MREHDIRASTRQAYNPTLDENDIDALVASIPLTATVTLCLAHGGEASPEDCPRCQGEAIVLL